MVSNHENYDDFESSELSFFQKIEQMGSGTYGEVWKGKNILNNEIIAIKKIKMDIFTEGIPSTTIREICLLKELNHPYIVEYFIIKLSLKDVVSTRNKIFLIFEHLNYDLKFFLEKIVPKTEFLNNTIIKSLVFQLLNGIAYCHSKRIIHRDLKPQNLLLKDNYVLKIADFGLARLFSIPIRPYTKEVLTLWYRSPEILLGSSEYTTAIDIWSIGCIFAEICTKKTLFQGDSEIDQLYKIFQILGTPNQEIWADIKNLTYYRESFPKWKKGKLEDVVKNLDSSGIDLLSKMLTYDPNLRISAKEALKHPYFKDVDCSVLLNYIKQMDSNNNLLI